MTTPAARNYKTILIIDDSVTNLKVAVDHLRAYSFDILIARSGAAGIERAQLAQPDLILLDIQMAGIDGFETCRRLKANPKTAGIPLIFMTALDAPADKIRGLELGAVDYLTKPIDAAELLSRVNTHLRLQALQDQLRQANELLEQRVAERTAALEAEIRQRVGEQAEKAGLLDLVRQQSEQLRQLTQLLLESQDAQKSTMQRAYQQLDQGLGQLAHHLEQARRSPLQGEPPAQANVARAAIDRALELLARMQQSLLMTSAELRAASQAEEQLRASPLLRLSDREYQIFQLLTQGRSNAEISAALFLAKTTVSTYQRRIMEKLGVSDLPGLVKLALERQQGP
jgi:DNA-binding response OmpR family regulator/DNA-binding CsgD family transcriptional regulator